MMNLTLQTHRLAPARRFLAAGAAVALLVAAGCGDTLVVETPDVLPPDALEGPAAIPTIHAGLVGDFSFAVVGDQGGSEGIILVGASVSDELGNSETFPTRKEYDIREMGEVNGTLTGLFRNLQRARRSAEKGAESIKAFAPNLATETRIAEAYNLAGTLYTYLGEHYCSGVPISDADPISGELIFGPQLTTVQLFEKGIQFFDSAAKYSVNTTQTNFAKVGKARALMNLGKTNFATAATLVADVPTNFRYVTTHTNAQSRQWNGVNAFINQFERFTLINTDGLTGINYMSAQDPRIPWIRTPSNDLGFDNSTPQFDQGIYRNETVSLPIASGIEARLIQAEAALNSGGDWLTILNTLRANTALYPVVVPGDPYQQFPPLAPLTDPGTQAAREDMVFRERAFWLFLTGHRQGDMRRLIRQYGRTETTVFPGGPAGTPYIINGNNKGGTFGNDVAIPIPFDELNNPQYVTNYPACKLIA
jgi:hypothetical protein